MSATRYVKVNDRWGLLLPHHRADRESWPWFEAARLSAICHRVVELDTPTNPRRPIVWDIGSECGDFAALCTSWGCSVVMVEPNPKAWPSASLTFEANTLTPLATVQAFAGDLDGAWELHDGKFPECADGPVVTDFGQYAIGENTAPEITLDALSLLVRRPDIVSIDVEGAELHVLRGARGLLSNVRPDVFLSIHPELAAARYGYGNLVETIRWIMCEYGYPHGGHTHLATDHEEHWWFRP